MILADRATAEGSRRGVSQPSLVHSDWACYFSAADAARAIPTFSRELNALIPVAPPLPKPAPGVQTTWALFITGRIPTSRGRC